MDGLNLIINRKMGFKVGNVESKDADLLEDDEIFADGMTRSQWMIMQPEYVALTRKLHDAIIENGHAEKEYRYRKTHKIGL